MNEENQPKLPLSTTPIHDDWVSFSSTALHPQSSLQQRVALKTVFFSAYMTLMQRMAKLWDEIEVTPDEETTRMFNTIAKELYLWQKDMAKVQPPRSKGILQ